MTSFQELINITNFTYQCHQYIDQLETNIHHVDNTSGEQCVV